jgi:biotin carboxylase
MEFSRCKRVIVEEYIEGPQFHGDAFVVDHKVVFIYLGDHYFNGTLNSSTLYPSNYPASLIESMEKDIQRFIELVGFKQGGINVEIRLSEKDGKAYIIEIGPRNGGHFTPDIIHYASGFDFIKSAVDTCLGEEFTEDITEKKGYFMNLVLYARDPGFFQNIKVNNELEPYILEKHIYRKKGDLLLPGTTSNTAVGTLLLKFDSYAQMFEHVEHAHKYYNVKVN